MHYTIKINGKVRMVAGSRTEPQKKKSGIKWYLKDKFGFGKMYNHCKLLPSRLLNLAILITMMLCLRLARRYPILLCKRYKNSIQGMMHFVKKILRPN